MAGGRMIVRCLDEIVGTDSDVDWGNGRSRRLLLHPDGMGYSLTDTVVEMGTESHLWYPKHLEACYGLEGEGEVQVGEEVWPIVPGTMYALDHHERHILRARTAMRLLCVFSPALRGPERHEFTGNRYSRY